MITNLLCTIIVSLVTNTTAIPIYQDIPYEANPTRKWIKTTVERRTWLKYDYGTNHIEQMVDCEKLNESKVEYVLWQQWQPVDIGNTNSPPWWAADKVLGPPYGDALRLEANDALVLRTNQAIYFVVFTNEVDYFEVREKPTKTNAAPDRPPKEGSKP